MDIKKQFVLILKMKNVISKFKNSSHKNLYANHRQRELVTEKRHLKFTQNATRAQRDQRCERSVEMADGLGGSNKHPTEVGV